MPLPASRSVGFSLVEVVVALGIIGFALIAIMGLFPVAMNSARDSQTDTRATLIARTMISDLRAGSWLAKGTNILQTADYQKIIFSGASNAFLAFDENGLPISQTVSSNAFATGLSDASYLVRLRLNPDGMRTGLCQVGIEVVTPGAAPAANRTTNFFVTLLPYE